MNRMDPRQITDRSTPHLDKFEEAREGAYEKTLDCPCRHPPPKTLKEWRSSWLKQYGLLCKKQTITGWRRAWQCQKCFRDMGGDGVNAGLPTKYLPEYLLPGHPHREQVTNARLALWEAEKTKLPSRRAAWFKDHDLYLQTKAWKKLREKVLERDGGACVSCGNGADHVHHLTYERWQEEELEDLVSLCRGCHEKEHAA